MATIVSENGVTIARVFPFAGFGLTSHIQKCQWKRQTERKTNITFLSM